MNGEIENTLKGAKYHNGFGLKLYGFEYYLSYTRRIELFYPFQKYSSQTDYNEHFSYDT